MRREPLLLLVAGCCLLPLVAAFAAEEPCDAPVARSASLTVPRAPLDIDGDSLSEYIAALQNKQGDLTEFWAFSLATGTTTTASLPRGSAVPADYDGDGKTDFATVSSNRGKRVWNIKRSSDGVIVSQTFGEADDSAIFGCRFVSNSRSSLVTVKGRSVLATELGADNQVKVGTLPQNIEDLIGCGDLAGEGDDDILFTVKSRSSAIPLVSTVACGNQVLSFRSIKDFRSGGVVQLDRDDFPLLITLRDLDAKRDIVTLQSVSELFPYPKFFFEKRAAFSSGRYRSADGTFQGYGIAYVADPTSNQVVQRLLEAQIPRPEPVVTLPIGYQLVQPQGVIR